VRIVERLVGNEAATSEALISASSRQALMHSR
jgi:hypothetical protein